MMVAPAKMIINMLVLLIVSVKLLFMVFQLSRLFRSADTNARNAPTAAASVGVQTPMYRLPMIAKKRTMMIQVSLRETIFSLKVVLGPTGPRLGLCVRG